MQGEDVICPTAPVLFSHVTAKVVIYEESSHLRDFSTSVLYDYFEDFMRVKFVSGNGNRIDPMFEFGPPWIIVNKVGQVLVVTRLAIGCCNFDEETAIPGLHDR